MIESGEDLAACAAESVDYEENFSRAPDESKDSIKTYVSSILRRHRNGENDEDLPQTIEIRRNFRSKKYESISAFRQYKNRADEKQTRSSSTTDDETESKQIRFVFRSD